MKRRRQIAPRPLLLGIEGGGTRTVALLAEAGGKLVRRFETGPGNLRLLSDGELRRLFREIAAAMPRPEALGIGLAGARSKADLQRIHDAAGKVWRGVPCRAANDLETALAAGEPEAGKDAAARVLILSGTGSCCYGKAEGRPPVRGRKETAKVGGWGHVLGDRGSGYEIGMNGLRAVIGEHDRTGRWPELGGRFLARLQLNEPEELIAWAQGTEKAEIAGLAVEVFAARNKGDAIAGQITGSSQISLLLDGLACARRLTHGGAVHFVLAGGVLVNQRRFARELIQRLRKLSPGATGMVLARESAWGAVALAREAWKMGGRGEIDVDVGVAKKESGVESRGLSPTERRNPRSAKLDKMTVGEAIKLMLSEDAKVPAAILAERKGIERGVVMIARALKRGGRLFYVGAGTSGRLGVLDASECPPTFRTSPVMVQGIIAGGRTALWRSVEGAEDDAGAGGRAMEFRGVNRRDVVVGIAASGRTPFVWGALGEAKRRGAETILLAFNPGLKIPRGRRPKLLITPDTGPEVLTGSTRLKAGTATKLILNIFTTLAMVRLGKVMGNLMVDLNASNAKLRERAVRMVAELGGVEAGVAREALERCGWVVRKTKF